MQILCLCLNQIKNMETKSKIIINPICLWFIFSLLCVICQSAGAKGGGGGAKGGGKGGNTDDVTGVPVQKIATGDLCEKNPQRADPSAANDPSASSYVLVIHILFLLCFETIHYFLCMLCSTCKIRHM